MLSIAISYSEISVNNGVHIFSTCCSSYCMTEFHMAYHHNVAVKRKKRLIVLMMLDSPTDLYDNDASDTATLRQYLRQYTYIDYTADDWEGTSATVHPLIASPWISFLASP